MTIGNAENADHMAQMARWSGITVHGAGKHANGWRGESIKKLNGPQIGDRLRNATSLRESAGTKSRNSGNGFKVRREKKRLMHA